MPLGGYRGTLICYGLDLEDYSLWTDWQ